MKRLPAALGVTNICLAILMAISLVGAAHTSSPQNTTAPRTRHDK